MGKTVEDYVRGLEGWQADVAAELRRVIRDAAPELTEAIKWGQPVYEWNGPVCYFKAHKNHVTFGFWRGVELGSVEPQLESSGSRMAHLKITATGDVKRRKLTALVKAAVDLNRKKGDPTKR